MSALRLMDDGMRVFLTGKTYRMDKLSIQAPKKPVKIKANTLFSVVLSQCSSVVEQRFRKPSVAGSIPAIGSTSIANKNAYYPMK